MEKRKLPHGSADERFSVLGLGLGGIQGSSEEEIEAVITKAIEQGINFFDLCAAHQKVYGPFGKAIRNIAVRCSFSCTLEQSITKREIMGGHAICPAFRKHLPGRWNSCRPIMWISDFCTVWMKMGM